MNFQEHLSEFLELQTSVPSISHRGWGVTQNAPSPQDDVTPDATRKRSAGTERAHSASSEELCLFEMYEQHQVCLWGEKSFMRVGKVGEEARLETWLSG